MRLCVRGSRSCCTVLLLFCFPAPRETTRLEDETAAQSTSNNNTKRSVLQCHRGAQGWTRDRHDDQRG